MKKNGNAKLRSIDGVKSDGTRIRAENGNRQGGLQTTKFQVLLSVDDGRANERQDEGCGRVGGWWVDVNKEKTYRRSYVLTQTRKRERWGDRIA